MKKKAYSKEESITEVFKLFMDGMCNWIDRSWLHFYILFAGTPEIAIVGAFGDCIKVFVKKKLIEFCDPSGSIIYRVEVQPNEDQLRLYFGASCEQLWPRGYIKGKDDDQVFNAFMKEIKEQAENILLGEE
jgi:hypothetical protein